MDDDALSDLAGDLASLVDGLRTADGRPVLRDLARSADPAGTQRVRVDILRGTITPEGPWSRGAEQPLRIVRGMVDQLAALRGGHPGTVRTATVTVDVGRGPEAADADVPQGSYRGRLEITDRAGRVAWAEVRG